MKWNVVGITMALTGALALSFGVFGQAAVASAQTATQATTGTSTLGSLFLDKLAEALGIQRSALDSALSSAAGATAAQAIADGTLTQAQADALTARAQAGDYGALFGGRGERGPGGPRVAGLHEAMSDAAAQALGLTADELRTALRDGQTVAELAAANGTTEDAVQAAALAAAKTALDQAVADGTLTQAQADQIYADLESRGLHLGPGGRGPRGPRDGAPPADDTAPAPADA